jgi:3-dehydroquinate synthase
MSSPDMPSVCTVELGQRTYPIYIEREVLSRLGSLCREAGLAGRALLVSDHTVAGHYGAAAAAALQAAGYAVATVTVPPGETSKSHEQLLAVYDAALAGGLDRAAFIVALGGGVVGDLAGYAAATYLRGVAYVQAPTSLLAMVDSSVGGKTGVNLPQGKNLIGSFHQPALVLADTATLQTLSTREFCSGLAEVVKYGVIADPEILDRLEGTTPEALQQDDRGLAGLIRRSCEIKADVVRQDEREGGLRAVLNFGHTLGHAIEQVGGYGACLHGEAIAIGMVFAARLSERLKDFPADETERLIRVLRGLQLPVDRPDLPWSALMAAMQRDKKKKAGTVGFVLAEKPGTVAIGCPVSDDVLEAVWNGMPPAPTA